ncbi:hypothetical protein H0H92_007503 [Tricholoma furcatifolium]|nr:hypothetical protein H0H92_007503 [Tricholoma furcatifolium]
MASPNPIILPVVTIDPTFTTVLHDVCSGFIPSEKFWISCYKASHPSVHAKITAELHAKDRDLVVTTVREGNLSLDRTQDDVSPSQDSLSFCPNLRSQKYIVSCGSLGIDKIPVLPPIQEYLDVERSNPRQPQRITAFDVSPDSSRFATGFLDGTVFLYPTSSTSSSSRSAPVQQITPAIAVRSVARAHLSTITHLQFFPSSRVLLSSGADFSLSILPADLPEPGSIPASTTTSTRLTAARTLRAHTRPITATAIIGAGRNILSSSLDGTLKLWDVPSSTVLSSISSQSNQPILSSTFASVVSADPQSLTDGTTVFCGLQNGSVQLFDLRAQNATVQAPTTPGYGGASALAHDVNHHLLAVGSSKGLVNVYDTRSMGVSVTSFKRGDGGAGVEDLTFFGREDAQLVVATSDGLPYVASILPDGPVVSSELVGGDCDPVRSVRVREAQGGAWDIWTAGDDAIVRRWRI